VSRDELAHGGVGVCLYKTGVSQEMLGIGFAIDSALVCVVSSLLACGDGSEGVAYISEYILLCKRGGVTQALPWACVAAFGALVFVQLRQMRDAAAAWLRRAGEDAAVAEVRVMSGGHGDDVGSKGRGMAFWAAATGAWVGLVLVVTFDWRDAGEASVAWHRVGVVMLATGGFLALQLVWGTLRAGDSVARLLDGNVAEVPYYSWVETDLVFVAVMAVFVVTTLVGTQHTLSAVCEYLAFGLLLVQTTWLMVLCAERGGGEDAVDAVRGRMTREGGSRVLAALLLAYAAEAGVVLLVVL